MTVRKVGVEEELLLVDPEDGRLTAVSRQAVRAHAGAPDPPGAPVEAELFLQQIETHTPPTTDLDELDAALRRSRRAVGEAAQSAGAAAVAIGTPVLADGGVTITPQPRYLRIRQQYAELAHSALACAMHVHVDIDSPEEGVRVIDGAAPWLPVLLAASANSPYLEGRDTGHASWRSQVWGRWPSAGTGEPFHDVATYHRVVDRLVEWGAALDPAMAYFDARLAAELPTVEVRVADVCTEVEDAVLVAALARALVATAAEAPSEPWRGDLLRASTWRAARYGLAERLVDPGTQALAPARDVLGSLVDHVRPALEEAGDVERVEAGVEALLARGGGATRQRSVLESTGSLEAVVADARRRTEDSWRDA